MNSSQTTDSKSCLMGEKLVKMIDGGELTISLSPKRTTSTGKVEKCACDINCGGTCKHFGVSAIQVGLTANQRWKPCLHLIKHVEQISKYQAERLEQHRVLLEEFHVDVKKRIKAIKLNKDRTIGGIKRRRDKLSRERQKSGKQTTIDAFFQVKKARRSSPKGLHTIHVCKENKPEHCLCAVSCKSEK